MGVGEVARSHVSVGRASDREAGERERGHVFERDGVKVVVDDVSLDLLAGAQLDYKDELIGSYFAVENPNATSSCGCGTSFTIG